MKSRKRVVVYLLILSMMLSVSPSVPAEAKSKKKANKQALKVRNYVLDSFEIVEDFVLEVINGEQYYYYKKSNLKKMNKKLKKQLKKGKKIDKVVKTKLKGKKYKTIRKYWKKLRASEKVIQKQAQQSTFQDKKLAQFRKEVIKFHDAYVKLYNNKDYQFLSRVAADNGVDGWSFGKEIKDKDVSLLYDNWDTKLPKKPATATKKPTSVTPTKSPVTPTKQPSSAVNPTNAPAGANQGDVKALAELIRTQKERGATVSEDMSSEEYDWKNGRLVEIYWGEWEDEYENTFRANLQGDISFSAFTALESLSCHYNNLSSIDVSGCVNLTELSCSDNQLGSLDVSKNVDLGYLSCSNNQLSSLDVSGCINLTELFCDNNQLSSLDIGNNVNLEYLSCDANYLKNLDVSSNVNLKSLSCNNNYLKNLDVSKNVNLEGLSCSYNNLSSLDISNNIDLDSLYCYNNSLKNLYISKNINLLYLICENNQLSNLDVSSCILLEELCCSNNLLNNLDISKNVNLEYLECENNLISTLDISRNINLEYLYCDDDVTIIRSGNSDTSDTTPGKTYHAYLGFQTDTYAFRDTWNHDTYGLDSVYLDYNSEIGYWRNNYLRREDVNITNAEISSDGTYVVSISDIDLQTLDTDTATEYFNTLYISTDIPVSKKGVQFTDAKLRIDDQIVARYDVLPQKGDAKDYYQLMLADIYAPDDGTKSCQYDSTNELDILPTDNIRITFTVSGITDKTSTETPTVKPTSKPTVAPTAKPTPDKTYYAYLGFQTNSYAFRDTWNHDTYGLDSRYLDYNSEIGYWKNNYLRRKDVNITNAEISSDGTYTVSISGIDLEALDTDLAAEYFNTLYISTDIPVSKKGVQFTDANLLIDDQTVARYDVIPQKGDAKDYYQLMLADIYAPDDGTKSCQYDSTNELDILPTDSITITFTVSGITEKTSTEKPTTEPVDTTTVANNYQKLADYIKRNGEFLSLEEDEYYISDFINGDDNIFASISYYQGGRFEFSYSYEADGSDNLVTLTIVPPDFAKGEVTDIYTSSSDFLYAGGEVDLSALTTTEQNITYTYTNTSGDVRDALYELGELMLGEGLQAWSVLLKDTNLGLTLKDLGFSSYAA